MPVLFEVSPFDPLSLARVPLRFCNVDDDRLTGLDDKKWLPGIARAPTLNREVFNGSFDTPINLAQAATVVHLEALRKVDPQSPTYRFAGAPLTVWYGDIDGSWDFDTPLFVGLVADHKIEDGTLQLTAQVDSEPFEANFLETKYGGTGGSDGVEDLKDRPKPACFGNAQNVEPVMINTVDNVFQVHGYGPIQAITKLYERAAEFEASIGDFPTYTALVQADIGEGEWGTCLAEGMFRLGAPPFGLITADVEGDNSGGFHQTTAAIMLRLCEIAGVDAANRIDSASMTAFEAAVPFTINLYTMAQEKLIDLLQRLARPCNAQAALSWTGKLQVTRFGVIETPTIRLDAQGQELPPVLSNSEINVSPPFWRMQMAANRSWRVHSKDEIAYQDDETEVPVTIYRRYPVQPPTPVGDDIPLDWSLTPGEYSPPIVVNGFPQFGPLWQSTAVQVGGTTNQNGWSQPRLADPSYQQWALVSQNNNPPLVGGTNAVQGTSALDPATDRPYTFINRPVTGPWRLRYQVRGALDRVAVGVIPYDPATIDAGFDLDDVKDGFYVAQNDTYAVQTVASGPVTGVFVFQEYDAGAGFVDGSMASVLVTPLAECEYEMIFNGETVEHIVNGERVRTHFINQSFDDSMKYWAVFMPLSPSAEIYNIRWERATQARELDYRLDTAQGAMRRSQNENGWETYAPAITSATTGAASLTSKSFKGGAYVKMKVGDSVPMGDSFFQLNSVGGFTFHDDGSYELDANGSTLASGTWVAGDEYGILWDRKQLKFYKNGALLKKKKRSAPSSSSLYLEFAAGASFHDIELIPRDQGEFQIKGSASDGTILTPILDTSPAITGGYIIVAETTDVVYSVLDDTDEVQARGVFMYSMTAGTAASFTPEVKVQRSTNAGGSWADWGGSTVGDPCLVGNSQQLSFTAPVDNVSGSGKSRYRLVVKNTVAGTYSVDTDGTLLVEWSG